MTGTQILDSTVTVAPDDRTLSATGAVTRYESDGLANPSLAITVDGLRLTLDSGTEATPAS